MLIFLWTQASCKLYNISYWYVVMYQENYWTVKLLCAWTSVGPRGPWVCSAVGCVGHTCVMCTCMWIVSMNIYEPRGCMVCNIRAVHICRIKLSQNRFGRCAPWGDYRNTQVPIELVILALYCEWPSTILKQ